MQSIANSELYVFEFAFGSVFAAFSDRSVAVSEDAFGCGMTSSTKRVPGFTQGVQHFVKDVSEGGIGLIEVAERMESNRLCNNFFI